MENNECTEQEMYDDLWKEIAEAEKIEMEKQNKIKDDFKEQLKGLINVKRLWEELDDNDGWMPEKIVEIKLTDEKSSGYPSYQHARIINDEDDRRLYMKQRADFDTPIKGIDHYYVWQTTGMLGDDYSGYVLYPLKDGKYLKVSYNC